MMWFGSSPTPPPPDWWMARCEAWPYGERLFFTGLASAIHLLVLYASCGLFMLADAQGFWLQCQLPRGRPDLKATTVANIALNRRAAREQMIGALVITPALLYVAFPAVSPFINVCGRMPPPTTWAKDIAIMIVGCDCIFYWVHRACHASPSLYKLHKQHHEFKATTVWASEYFGIVDFLLNVLPGVLPALVLRVHLAVLMLFTALRMWQTVQSHSGYDLPYDPFNRGIFHGGARRHDFHHSHHNGCFADFLPFWDWLCGTDAAYTTYWQKHRDAAAY